MNRKLSEHLLTKCISEYHINNVQHYFDIGSQYIKDKKIVFVSIARDISDRIENLQKVLEAFSEQEPKALKLFIYENDSKDDTVAKLEDWKSKKDYVDFQSEKRYTPDLRLSTDRKRTENLAYARNQCVEYVRENCKDFDYVIVIDSDLNDYSTVGLLNTFGYLADNNKINAVAGCSYLLKHIVLNNRQFSDEPQFTGYDCWAYRHTDWYDNYSAGLTYYWFQFYVLPIGSNPYKVLSAFGGSCVYKTQDYLSGTYSGEDCEHVTFHKSISDKNPDFNLYVNPSQIFIV